VRQFAVENALLAGTAFTLAWLLAGPLTTLIISRLPAELTRGQYLAPDGRTVIFSAAISLLGLAVLTMLPIDLVRRAAPLRLLSGRLADTPIRAERVRMGMLAAQMALTAALLYVAGLAVHSFARVTTFDYGFDAENVLVFTPPPVPGGGGSGRPIEEFLANLAERRRQLEAAAESLMRVPGVVAAEVFSALPLQRRRVSEYEVTSFDGQPVEPGLTIRTTSAGPRFVEALGARMVAGYGFDRPDYAGTPNAAVINETLARRLSMRRVGNLEIRGSVLDRELRTERERFVITGAVRDLVQSSPGVPPEPQLFSARVTGGLLAIRTTAPVEASLPAVRTTLQRTFGDLPPRHFGFLRDELREVQLPYRGQSILLGLIAAFCLPLAAVGLTGALLYFVQSRTRETAIRMALGADPAGVRRMVVRRALAPVGIGIVAGTAAGIAMGRIVASQLFHVHPVDPVTTVSVAAALLGLAWLAALLPARHACRVDPAVALRDV
jgi:putative ABC transport system permease protein